jgi:5-methyltetrahydrofolate--homocysteine methyltransferase
VVGSIIAAALTPETPDADLDALRQRSMALGDRFPLYPELIAEAAKHGHLQPAVVYGYWPCASERNDVIVYDPASGAEAARLHLPRQTDDEKRHLCIADWFRPRGGAPLADEQAFIPAAAWANGARDVPTGQSLTRPSRGGAPG